MSNPNANLNGDHLAVLSLAHQEGIFEAGDDRHRPIPGETVSWKAHTGGVYRCMIHLHPEDGGGFSVTVPSLSGAVSEGDGVDRSLGNIREAIAGLIESYQADGEDIPWRAEVDQPQPQPGDLVKWVVVHV